MANYEDMELKQSQQYTKLQIKAADSHDNLYNVPEMCSNETNPLPSTRPHESLPCGQQASHTSNNGKLMSSVKNKFLIFTVFAILIAVNVIVMVCLLAIVSPNSSEANKLKEVNSTMCMTKQLMAQHYTHHQMIQEHIVNSVQTLNQSMNMLMNIIELQKIQMNDVREVLMLISSLPATVNQTMGNIESLQQTMDTTLPAIENTSKSVNNIITLLDPNSCQDIKEVYASTSGYYTINGEEVYCGMDLCGTNKAWKRLAYLDMTDTTIDCPSGLKYYGSDSVRACGRPTSSGGSCASLKFPSNGISYSEVCGRVVGYQYASPDGIVGTNIDSYYVDGVSITSGNPRTHVWTLMGDVRETSMRCPCSSGYSGSPPSFMGNDYFCESGNENLHGSGWANKLFTADPLWDGNECNFKEANCCQASASGIPWFHKIINTTSDYLELRVCGNEATSNENTPLSFYEIYVK